MANSLINETSLQSDVTSGDEHHPSRTGVLLHIAVTNVSGTPSYDFTIEARVADTYLEIARVNTSITSAGDFVYLLRPGITNTETNSGNDVDETFNLTIPDVWRVKVIASTADGSNNADITVKGAVLT